MICCLSGDIADEEEDYIHCSLPACWRKKKGKQSLPLICALALDDLSPTIFEPFSSPEKKTGNGKPDIY